VVINTRTELIRLEKDFWDAMKQKDGEKAARLTAEGCILAGAQGVSTIEPDLISRLTVESNWSIENYEIDDDSLQVRMLHDGVAVIAYKVREKLTVDGQSIDLEASESSVWIEEDGAWKCALHTESLLGDSFGRDRKRG
jgi:hypothetical protein